MRVKVWSGIFIVGLLLTAGCGNQYTEYGPSDNAMMANHVQSGDQVQVSNNQANQPAQVSPVSVPFMAIAGMSPGLVKPIEEPAVQQQPINSPVFLAGNNQEPIPPQETLIASNATESKGPVTMTKIDRSANQPGNIRPVMGNNYNNSIPLPSQQQLAYPAGGMFMYQAGQKAPANQLSGQSQAPQGNQVMTARTSSNPYVDAILKQAANYKRVYSVTSGQFFDPKTNEVFQTIQ